MSNIKIEKLDITDAFIVRGKRFLDDRGFFEELYNESKFEKPITKSWKQVSLASSQPDVLRGLHCSNYAKFVTCVKGEVYDVIVDLRPDSPTFMKWQGVWLNADDTDPAVLYVPKRCGHGYYCKRDSLFLYLQDGVYNPKEDIELNLFDPTVKVDWPKPINSYIISEKDRNNPKLDDLRPRLESCRISLAGSQTNGILIYGSRGFLGGELVDLLKKTGRDFIIGKARLENRQDLIEEIKTTRPSQVICMAGIAGRPNISWFETNQVEGIRANIIGQLNIADVANEFNLHCTLLSTGVIYNYDEKHPLNSGIPFKEEEEPNYSGNFYAKIRIIEEKLLESYPNALNLRISYPTTGNKNPNSFLSKLIRFKTIQSVPMSITVVDDLWPVLVEMSDKKISGTFNFNNPGAISHDEVLQIYKRIVDNNHSWEVSEPNLTSRSACELSAQKLLDLGFKIPHVKESFENIIKKLKDQQ